MTRDDIIGWMQEVGAKKSDLTPQTYDGFVDIFQRFAALVAAAEQRPITDVTEAVTKTVIEVEKLLCEKIGRQWQPSGMSIQTLVDELAALAEPMETVNKTPAQRRERIAAAALQGVLANFTQWLPRDTTWEQIAVYSIRAADALIVELDKPKEQPR